MYGIKTMKKLLLTLALGLFAFQANASHLLGGEIIWKCKPNGKYQFTLVLYRDCGGIGISTAAKTLVNNAGASIVCNFVSQTPVVPTCFSSGTNFNAVTECQNADSGEGKMEKLVFRSGDITLTGTPPAGGWWFTWYSCCRPGTISNGPSNEGYLLRAQMRSYTPPGSTTPLSAGTATNATCYDSSPNFLEDPQVISCTNNDVTYNNLGYDPDLDSLYYDWAAPLRGPSGSTSPTSFLSVNFSTGYSATSPLPSNSTSTPASLNGETGEIAFKSSLVGSWATCVKIESWRCGQLIAEIYRDIPIFTLGCNTAGGQACSSIYTPAPPDVIWTPDSTLVNPIIPAPVTNLSGDTLYYYAEGYPGDTVKFTISASDGPSHPDCSTQNITFLASGGGLSSATNYNNPNSCLFNPPCATITSKNPGGVFEYPLSNTVEFDWTLTCDHLFYQEYQCGNLKSEYEFYFRMQDDECPVNKITYQKLVVKALNYMPRNVNVDNSCISQDPVTGAVTFDWVNDADTGFNFDYYIINHIDTMGNTTVVDTIYDWSTQTYTHTGAHPNAKNAYTIQTGGGCGLLTEPTDTIQNVKLELQALTTSIARLDWNRWMLGDTNSMYDVWLEAPSNSGFWTQLGSTNDTTWTDTVVICNFDANNFNYQVRFNSGCESSLDSGFFKDINEPSPVVFDSVTVSSGNLSALAWQASPEGDVTSYVIYKEDLNGSWQPIDTVLAADLSSSLPWVYPQSNAENESEKFIVTALDSCGNQSFVNNTIPSSTIHLKIGIDPCDGYARLRWGTYKTWTQTEPLEYNLYADITDPVGGTISGVLLKGGTLDTAFNHYGIVNGYTYCYYVKAVDTTRTVSSTSNRVCNSSAVVQGSRVLYLGRASVNSQNGVDMYAYIDKDADVIDFQIQRADDEIGPYLTIGSVAKPANGPWEVKFVDNTADPMSRSYFYRITSRDSCGALDTVSNIATNVHLQVEAIGNLTCALNWTPYRDFDGGVEEYKIYRSVDGGNSFSFVSSTEDTAFIDDIKPYYTGKGKFCYYVVAIAADGLIPWRDELGNPFSARSNVGCAIHKARLWFPSAFNPYSDVVENRVWKPEGVFARPDSYTLFILDRWGQEVFRTDDIDQGWDGKIKGKDALTGVYTYFIKYRSTEDVPLEERGNFTLYY